MLLETIRISDGTPLHLSYHQHRMDMARRYLWRMDSSLPLGVVCEAPAEYKRGRVKCRITYDYRIHKVEWSHYTPKRERSLQLVDGADLNYAFKYADRKGIERLMGLRGDADDILIVKDNLITDTSYCNVVCFDGSRYFTPAEPLLAGTCRARLIAEGVLETADIRPEDLAHFQKIFLINAMLDLGECAGNWNKNLTFASLF